VPIHDRGDHPLPRETAHSCKCYAGAATLAGISPLFLRLQWVDPRSYERIEPKKIAMELKTVPIEKPTDINFILGQSHFIKTIEDLHEAIVQTVPQMTFGIAFCESSGPALVRWTGNDEKLLDLAKKNAVALGCGHCFIIFMSSGFPINILNTIKAVPEVCAIYCATGNPVEVIVAETDSGRGILGVIDGMKSKGIETESDIAARKQMLRKFGYKL
jgi:adenosine/AMP kinase